MLRIQAMFVNVPNMNDILSEIRVFLAFQPQSLRVATAPNSAVQHGPIALPNLLCTLVSVAQKLCPRNGPANA
jgi:hypothetical protein